MESPNQCTRLSGQPQGHAVVRKKRPRSSDFVSRIKNASFDGYRVRIDRADFPYTCKHFSVARYGTVEAAEQAALEFRRSLAFDVPANGAHLHDPRNPHDLVGVSLDVCRRRDGTIKSVGWRATWWDGESRVKTFAVVKYGWQEAFRLAVAARERNTTQLSPAAVRRTPRPSLEVWAWARPRGCAGLPRPREVGRREKIA